MVCVCELRYQLVSNQIFVWYTKGVYDNENCLIAFSDYGNGSVLAVGDPWFYNEYYDNRKLPKEFENYKAAENLFLWLKDKINHK